MVLRASKQYAEILAAGDGEVRVSKQYVEILTIPITGEIRATRQYIEILTKQCIYERTLTDSLVFTDLSIAHLVGNKVVPEALTVIELLETDHRHITDAIIFTESAEIIFSPEDTLTLTEDAHLGTVYRQLEESIIFDEAIVLWHNNIKVNETLTFTEDAIGHIAVTYEESLNDNLTFTENASYVIIPFVHLVSDTLILLEAADTDEKGRTFDESLVLTEAIIVTHSVKTQELIDSLPLYEEIIVNGTQSFTVTDNLTDDVPKFDDDGEFYFEHLGLGETLKYDHIGPRPLYEKLYLEELVSKLLVKRTGHPAWLTDTLVFTESAERLTSSISDELIFTDVASYQKDTPNYDEITFTEVIIVGKILIPTFTDTFTINEDLNYELNRTDTLCTYSPFVGTTTDANAPLAPSVITPVIVKRNNIELSYEGTVITLRGPEFGNRNKLNYHRINRESRGGTLTVFADPRWPKQQTMLLDFYGLYETEAQEVLDFIILTLGKQFSIRDWENQHWSGIIISPDNAIIRNHNNNCSISLEIIVQKEFIYAVFDTLVFYDSAVWGVYDTIVFVEDADYPTLTWKTFTGLEWETFSTFEWNLFIGE